jgi:hypothetical protein
MNDPLVVRRGRITGGFRVGAGCTACTMLIWALGLVALYYSVHTQIVFLNPPILVQENIPYYNRPVMNPDDEPIDGSDAEVGSFAWYTYTSDYLLITVPPLIGIAVIFDLICAPGFGSVIAMITLVIIALLEAAKSFYFSMIWFSFFGYKCQEYPFCINRSLTEEASTADSTFVIETIGTYIFTALAIILIFVVPAVFRSGRRERELLLRSSRCAECKEKTKSFTVSSSSSLEKTDLVIGEPINDSASDAKRRPKKTRTTVAVAAAPIGGQAQPYQHKPLIDFSDL